MKLFARWGVLGLGLGLGLAGCGGPTDGKRDVAVVQVVDPSPKTTVAVAVTPGGGGTAGGGGGSAPASAGFGTIKGKVVWGGEALPEVRIIVKKGDSAVKDAEVCAVTDLMARELVVNKENKGVANVFVYINKPVGQNPQLVQDLKSKMATVTVDQKNCEYLPYATAMMFGQKLNLKSSDPVNHNVRGTPFNSPAFNFILPPGGSTEAPLKAAERAPVELKCDIHPFMSGWFYVLDHPFFAVTNDKGEFEIKGVPVGAQNVVFRTGKHGFIGSGKNKGQSVTVEAGKDATLDATFDPSSVK